MNFLKNSWNKCECVKELQDPSKEVLWHKRARRTFLRSNQNADLVPFQKDSQNQDVYWNDLQNGFLFSTRNLPVLTWRTIWIILKKNEPVHSFSKLHESWKVDKTRRKQTNKNVFRRRKKYWKKYVIFAENSMKRFTSNVVKCCHVKHCCNRHGKKIYEYFPLQLSTIDAYFQSNHKEWWKTPNNSSD